MGYDYSKIELIKAITIATRIRKQKAIKFGATQGKIEETIKYKKAD